VKLGQYRSMRDFAKTPEPAGTDQPAGEDHGSRFVVQEHHATALHWDVRFERDGVLVSWAVPKGLPPDPRENHLAVHTEDHPMEYLEFDGDIPEAEYGGGRVQLWDTGTYVTEKWEDREVVVVLDGRRVRGRYAFIRTRGRDWLVHRMDPPQDPDRRLMPPGLRPAAHRAGRVPRQPERYAFEPVFGGLRVVVSSSGGRITVTDESGGNVTERFPELSALGRALGATEVALDGEIVGDPAALARRATLRSDSARRRAARDTPLAFVAADVLWLEGHPTDALPFAERRRLLEDLALTGPAWQTTPSHRGEGRALLAASREHGLAGVLARPLDRPGPATFVPSERGDSR